MDLQLSWNTGPAGASIKSIMVVKSRGNKSMEGEGVLSKQKLELASKLYNLGKNLHLTSEGICLSSLKWLWVITPRLVAENIRSREPRSMKVGSYIFHGTKNYNLCFVFIKFQEVWHHPSVCLLDSDREYCSTLGTCKYGNHLHRRKRNYKEK